MVHAAENDQIKYFAQNYSGRIHPSMCKLLFEFPAAAINYV